MAPPAPLIAIVRSTVASGLAPMRYPTPKSAAAATAAAAAAVKR